MPDPNAAMLPPLGADPGTWLELMRQQQVAQYATENALSPTETPMYGRMASRISPLTPLSKVASALLASRAQKRAMETQGQLYGQMGNYYGGPSVSGGQPVQSQDDQSVMPAGGNAPFQFHPAGPGYVPGVDPQVAMRAAMSNPTEFAKLQQGPGAVALARYAGANPQQAAQGALTKELSQVLRPNQTLKGPNGETYIAADPEHGVFYQVDQQGRPQAIPITDSNLVEAIRQHTLTAARETATPRQSQFQPDRYIYPQAPNDIGPPAPPRQSAGPAPAQFPPAGASQAFASPASNTVAPAAAASAPPTARQPYFPSGPSSTAGDLEAQRAGAKAGLDYATGLRESNDSALKMKQDVQEMRNIVPYVNTGAGADARMHMAAIARAMGASPESVMQFFGLNPGDAQALEKLTGTMAGSVAKSLSSRGATNFEFKNFLRMNPNAGMTPEGFTKALDYIDKQADVPVDRFEDFAQWRQANPHPYDWEVGHSAHWNSVYRDNLKNGKYTVGDVQATTQPGAAVQPKTFASEADFNAAHAAGKIKDGDKVVVGGRLATWHEP